MKPIRRSKAKAEQAALVNALPESLDLVTVVIGAGGTIRDAVETMAQTGPEVIKPSVQRALARSEAGDPLDQTLRQLRTDLGPGFQPLTGALLLGHEQGGPVGLLLARLAGEAVSGRRRRGELQARRIPVALLAPLILCSLPSVLVGVVLPLAFVSFSQISL